MEHSDHWIMTGLHGEQWDFQNNEKSMKHSDHWIMTGWHGEQWYFQNNEKTFSNSLIIHEQIDQSNTSILSRACVWKPR
jgi:hypothetical protein